MSLCVITFTKLPVILPVKSPQVTPNSCMYVKSDAPSRVAAGSEPTAHSQSGAGSNGTGV